MSFTYGWIDDDVGNGMPVGNTIMRMGWFKATGVDTGDIVTGHKQCQLLIPQIHAAACPDKPVVVAEVVSDVSMAAFAGTVTIVCNTGDVGRWISFGN